GLHFDIRGNVYTSIFGDRRDISDADLFTPRGILKYDLDNAYYQIETPSKTKGETYEGTTFIYDDKTQDVIFEGQVDFSKAESKDFRIISSALGTGNAKTGNYSMDLTALINFAIHPSIPSEMALDLTELLERVGLAPAHDNSVQLMYKLANIIGDEPTRDFEARSLRNYVPLVESDRNMAATLGISNVKMEWSIKHKSWYNTSKIGLSHVDRTDINAKMPGFMEISKNETEQDVINIFLQPSGGTWYYFGYSDGELLILSSNEDFNNAILDKTKSGKTKSGELIYQLAEAAEVLTFINNFRLNHQGITEPYDLELPGDINFDEDESFDTIQKEEEDDDGFGF
ncbi:MAG: hypothetical protein AAFO69_17990, partial [Bacteroidota bacterium]